MSEEIVTFFVQGKPVAQPRPHAVRNRGFAKVIEAPDQHKIHDWKHAVRFEAKTAMRERLPFNRKGVGLRVELVFQFDRPESLKVPKWRDTFLLVTSGKDVDNLAKSLMDSCNGLLWDDDRRVSTLIVRKQYVMPNQVPGVRVGVFVDEPEQLPFFP